MFSRKMTCWTGSVLALLQGFGIALIMGGLDHHLLSGVIGGAIFLMLFGVLAAKYQKQKDQDAAAMLQELREEIKRKGS